MSDRQGRAYRRGDKVAVRWMATRQWISGRVITGTSEQARVAVSAPSIKAVNWGTRWIPIGTPLYVNVPHSEVHFVAAEPTWDPYLIEPFMTPDEYRFLDGNPKRPHPHVRHSSRQGAYLPATSYSPGDPIWVWEDSWHRAVVVATSRSWVNASLANYKDRKGNKSKGFRPPFVWPVINDWPAPTMHIFSDPTIMLVETRPGFYAAMPNTTG